MRFMRMMGWIGLLLILYPGAADGSDWVKLYEDANRYFSRGIDAEEEERDTLINTAAGMYERIIRESRISNGYLYYNLGNCYLALGEIGPAILQYRRAERLIPGYDNLRENLQTAIAQRIDKDQGGQLYKIVKTLSLQNYWFNYSTTLILFSLFFVLLWFLLVLRLLVQSLILKALLIFAIAAAFLFGLASGIYLYNDFIDTSGVITAKTSDARKGPGIRYEQSFTSSLHEGTEFFMLERQAEWMHIELESGEDCWIPDKDAQLVKNKAP